MIAITGANPMLICLDGSAEQMMVFQVIEKSGNLGIWVRDIKAQTNIQHQVSGKHYSGTTLPLADPRS